MLDSLVDKKILVTGSAGFIGNNLIKKLIDIGNKKITGTLHKSKLKIEHDSVKYIECDLLNPEHCDLVTKDIDIVFMCAAITHGAAYIENNPLGLVNTNIIINTNMLNSCYDNNVEKFVCISSSTVYPNIEYPFKEEEMMSGPVFDKYFGVAWVKRFVEILCEMYACKIKNPMKTLVVRPGNIYGEHDDFEIETSHVIPALIRKVVERNNPLEVWGDGNDVRDFIYVKDFIDGLLLATDKIDDFMAINIASGTSISVKEVLNVILEVEDYKNVNVIFDISKPSMIPKRLLNISKSKELLGFVPEISIEDGIRRTVKWYKKEYC